MAIKVHGIPLSTATARVLATLHEKGIEYELVPIDFKAGEHKKEPFLSLQPFGQIPAFEDGDLKLFESRAITGYICYNYADKGTPLVNRDPKVMATIAVWLEVEAHKFDEVASKLSYELVVKKMFGMPVDEAAAAQHEEGLAKVLDIYEARLKESKYLAGETFTLADLHHIPVIHYLMESKAKDVFTSRPHVSARPAWVKVIEMRKKK